MGKLLLILLIIIFEISGLVNIYLQYPTYPLLITIFNVGQGDSILIETSKKTKILIDTGPDERIVEKMASKTKIIDKRIDYVILSHPDMDHIGGMIGLLNNFDVKNVVFNFNYSSQSKYINQLLKSIEEENINIIEGYHTSDMYIDDCYFDFFWPRNTVNVGKALSDNDSSISIKLRYKGFDMFFGGDISTNIENLLIDEVGRVEVLKLSHHGSNTSNGPEFLESLSPQVAIISVGKNNKYNHPSKNVLNNLEDKKIQYLRTDIDGDIECGIRDGVDYRCFSVLAI